MDQLPPPPYPSLITTGLIAVSVIFPVVSASSILLRLWARRKSRQSLHADDWWIIASWFLTLGLSILVWVFTARSGIDFYRPDVDFLTGTENSLELIFISSCYVQFPLAAVKIAVLLFYKRIFTTPWFRAVVWCVIGLVSVWAVVFFLCVLLQIDPVAFPIMTAHVRFDAAALGLGQVASSFTLDLLVLCLPIPVIAQLHMKWERKVAVALIFWLGAFCAVAAIVRTVLLNESIRAVTQSNGLVSNQSRQYIFMVLEPNCSILAACLPTYGPLVSGGRAPESLVRSVRSVFSLRSIRSNNGSGGGGSLSRSARHNNNKDAGESQVELHDADDTWSAKVSSSREANTLATPIPPPPPLSQTRVVVRGGEGDGRGGQWA
ncbi:hypothetical protein C8A03DRAFT_37651 [Achaetomium macrosporum]|uniref:Rhodopsin domain-containing protein n=1 Tax=Achaetomium macrosporum TaxID=79813 RepID=A0AAN7C3H9_9PEZI|nr:hypothetical protein C8A03DRAFT_37651 [Achaetomium macrosporum]